jgi:hypothetical protein
VPVGLDEGSQESGVVATNPEMVRKIPPPFSWIDQRLVREHHIQRLSHAAGGRSTPMAKGMTTEVGSFLNGLQNMRFCLEFTLHAVVS